MGAEGRETTMSFSYLDTVVDEKGTHKDRFLTDDSQLYRFTNIDDEPYVGRWNGKEFVKVPAGHSVTIPESKAIVFAKDLCTRVMLKEEKAKFVPNLREATWEESQKTRTGIPMARKPYEDRILQKLEMGEETPETQALRSQLREQILSDMNSKVSTESPASALPKSTKDLSVVKDKRTLREGHEFEGVKSLK